MSAREHGTRLRYVTDGCRCDECRAAQREYVRANRMNGLLNGTLTHGRRATYDAGCRCEHCRDARRIAYYMLESEGANRRHRRVGLIGGTS